MGYLEKVQIPEQAGKYPSQLSGGQQQRVFLARALAQDATIYFMDEPFAGVDAATEQAIIALLHELRRAGKTVLVVHHDLQTVPQYFDHVMLLNMRIVASGPTRDVVVANASAALWVSGLCDGLETGAERACKAIDNGQAAEMLKDLVELTNKG